MSANTTIALKLHAFGLAQLHDPNWTGMDMFDRLKQHTRGRTEPHDLLRRTLKNGLLYYIGTWLFEDFFFNDTHRMALGGEYRFWYMEDLVELLIENGVSKEDPLIIEASSFISGTNPLYDENEEKYWEAVDSDLPYSLTDRMIASYEVLLRGLIPVYAANYAERVFHDRQLCEHISKTLVVIGFDGTNGDGEPKQWIERQSWPSWAVKAVVARDRGCCAACGVSITSELNAEGQIDHIVPLAKGGTNDLVNLQLLCDQCNNTKSASLIDVKSSIPQYLQPPRRKKAK
jgi:hypothetical protein